jgi:hypothetical protein
MRPAVALVFAGSVAAHFVRHQEHENFLRALHSSNFPPTPVKRQNDIPPLESLGPALPSEPAVPLRVTPTAGAKSPVNGAPDLPPGTRRHLVRFQPMLIFFSLSDDQYRQLPQVHDRPRCQLA